MIKSSLMAVIDAAAKRFDQRPLYHASDATRAELQRLEGAPQDPGKQIAEPTAPVDTK